MANFPKAIHRHIMTKMAAVAVLTLSLNACSSVSLPKLDLLKLPEFKEESENIGDYPKVVDAPGLPTDVRSAGDWDNTAKDILKARASVAPPAEPDRPKTPGEITQEIDRLTEQVNEYRVDDPQ